ncbi:hypothetical protein Tco_1154944 [Tanacetum coccineum]
MYMKFHWENLTLRVPNNLDSTSLVVGDDEGVLQHSDKDDMIQQKGLPKLGAPPPPWSPQSFSTFYHRCHSSDESLSCLVSSVGQDGQQGSSSGSPFSYGLESAMGSLVIGVDEASAVRG